MTNTRNFVSDDNISSLRVMSDNCLHHPPDSRPHRRSFQGIQAKRALLFVAVAAACLSSTNCAKKVDVPDVTQQDLDQAEKTITAATLKVGTVSGISSGGSTTGAYVSSQNPAAGQQVAANSTVDLVAVPPVLVPDLTKSNVTDAVSTLQGAGLQVAFVKQPTTNIFSRGGIKQQTPAPNTLVRHDAVVTLTVEAPPNVGGLLGMATKEPAYQKLNPKYRNVLDQLLNPQATASTANGAPPNGTTLPNGTQPNGALPNATRPNTTLPKGTPPKPTPPAH